MLDIRNNDDEATKSIVSFLRNNVPKSDIQHIETELKKDFLLAKKKRKQIKKQKHARVRTLTRKEKKSLCFYNLPRKSLKYCEMLKLNTIWIEYISQLLEIEKLNPDYAAKGWDQMTQTLYRADFHGSILNVIRSKCPSYVDKVGICIMDTKNTFKLLSEDNIITTIPKKDSVFEMQIKNKKVLIYGKHLCIRPAERSVKKIKSQLHPDL